MNNKRISYFISHLVNGPVNDCKGMLECELRIDPQGALLAATSTLEELKRRDKNRAGKNGQPSRKKVLQTIINKANKLLAGRKEQQS
ncbi:hypothetical protein [Shewanella sp. MTB7]|uniref:hypothetical protein n=2 Tax=unclassified Shewanella TaxID=196818 RepID=UPI0022BA6DD6|nr:hypothetical protein [Shewanella sp. MTB7]WBJ96719.1 hypothetical protein HWQ47_06280 [Shewanella sp. MTB7]